ncbi:hypothetical protein PYW08_014451 [Mythimna loreyi]|uniref:Uncharacterized protein n=1 Tax=Mythimna loreyi TaxID=667449 RepID=A0ACC2R2G8_9NEOP|nr:hypothetical protein PYW08_014451 [Mythimna loreyi]
MAKELIILTVVSLCVSGLNAILYDCVSGKPANRTQLRIYAQRNNTGVCTVDVKPCDPKEWQRVDGSCNNLKYPSRGTHRTPTIRLLPLDFSPNNEPRKAADGGDLELARRLRTQLLSSGEVSNMKLTQLVAYFLLFSLGDINSIHDPLNYLMNITNCCTPEGKKDYRCTPLEIPPDDPVHRFSGIRCYNLTRPQSFQTYGCLDNNTDFVRIVFQTPIYDLSNVYNLMPGFIDRIRSFKNGMLKIEKGENGYLFPESDPDSTLCLLNQRPRETRCHKYLSNNGIGTNLLSVLFYRQHNKLAEDLHKLNPSWNDERLFFTARNINIAIFLQIFIYELMPIVLGRRNLIRDGIISREEGFRDLYDEDIPPQTTDEYAYSYRWFHTIQETNMKLYDSDGSFLRTFPMVNLTTRTGFLAVGENIVHITQGGFRQESAGFDYTIDIDMGDRTLGGSQLATDVGASDLAKGRYFGFPPYITYKELFENRSYESFSDLEDSFSPERLYRVMQTHKSPENIDLLGGMWAEKHVKGGMVPETLYSIVVEQLKRTMASDRYWYESSNRPHAFNKKQLKEIRKVSIAGLLCCVGDHVTEIQPKAFYTISSKNPLVKCGSSKIGKLDLSPWKE